MIYASTRWPGTTMSPMTFWFYKTALLFYHIFISLSTDSYLTPHPVSLQFAGIYVLLLYRL